MRCLVSAYVFPLLLLTLSFCSASSVVSVCLSVLFLQLVLLRIYCSLSVGGLPFGRVHGSSQYFFCFLFRGLRALPPSSVGLVPLFLLQSVVFHHSAFFLFGVPFFFFSGLSLVLAYFLSSGSSLGRVCPAIGVLDGVSYFGQVSLGTILFLFSSRGGARHIPTGIYLCVWGGGGVSLSLSLSLREPNKRSAALPLAWCLHLMKMSCPPLLCACCVQ